MIELIGLKIMQQEAYCAGLQQELSDANDAYTQAFWDKEAGLQREIIDDIARIEDILALALEELADYREAHAHARGLTNGL